MADVNIPETSERFIESLKRKLNELALEAAEPHIQTALKAIERDMRKQVAASLISLIEHQVSYRHNREELVIRFGAQRRVEGE